MGVSWEDSRNGTQLGTQSPMNVVLLPNIEPMRWTREDMASDSVTGVWFSLYWGLCGHQMHAPAAPLRATEGVMGPT